MDHKILCTAFRPPAPQSLDGYLDHVTRNEVKTIKLGAMNALDRALGLIVLQPSATERAALLATLEERIEKFGRENGWMESPPPKDEATRIDEISSFVIKEIFGLKVASSQDLAVGAFTAKLKEFIKEHLNAKGKKSFVLLQFIYDLCQAKTPEEARNVLLKSGSSSLAKWVASHVEWKSLLKSGLRLGGVRPVVINRLTKLIAVRLTSLEIKLARFARLSPSQLTSTSSNALS
jgi:hypothetical protein